MKAKSKPRTRGHKYALPDTKSPKLRVEVFGARGGRRRTNR